MTGTCNVTSGGRILKGSDKLKSCEVRDGSIVEVTSRIRGGGRHKDKKSKVEKKQITRQEPLKSEGPGILESDKDAVIRMLEENEHSRKIVDDMSGGSDIEVKRKMQHWETTLQAGAGLDEGQMKVMECGFRWAVEARRQGRDEPQEQRRQAQQGQEQSKQDKQVRFGEKQQLEKREAENAGESVVMGRTTEVRTGRGRAGLVPGVDESRRNQQERQRKGQRRERRTRRQRRRIWPQRKRGGAGPNGAKHGGRWLTRPGHVASRKGRKGEERNTSAELRRLQ